MPSSSSMARSEIRLDHRRLVQDPLGRSLRDLLAVVARDDPTGQPAEKADLVVHEAQRGARGVNLVEDGLQVTDLVAPEPGGGLVEEQQLWLARQGHGDAEHLLLAVGAVAGELSSCRAQVAEGKPSCLSLGR